MKYLCGPGGVPPSVSGWYVSRPIMNLRGMSLDSKKVYIRQGDMTVVGPGEFWCEWFEGTQYSVDYTKKNGSWVQTSCYSAERDVDNLSAFKKWIRYEHKIFSLHHIFDDLLDLNEINVEFIDDRPIEVHLRSSQDPQYEELIPIWHGQEDMVDIYLKLGYNYIESPDDCDGFLKTKRIGFIVR
jgi:hypothetical protein